MKKFNTTAVCIPSKHYMVDLSDRIKEIMKLVDEGEYFTINRARQYGKTTTLAALAKSLQPEHVVISTSFEGIGGDGFADENAFVREFCRLLRREFRREREISEEIKDELEALFHRGDGGQKPGGLRLGDLFDFLLHWCEESEKGIILIIDEVDTATNNQVFLDFLAQLRDNYINRDTKGTDTFQSVILAGVTDVKHLKSRIRNEEGHKENSPWNIAADFTIDMSLPERGIRGMLDEYEADHHTGMDTAAAARKIREYTNGYPFLVSRICQLADEKVSREKSLAEAWTDDGLEEAIKLLLAENNTLFQSLTKNLNNYPELKASIRSILMEGTKLTYNAQQDAIARMQMYGLIRNDRNAVRVANRIFETMLYNLFLSEEELKSNVFSRAGDLEKNRFVEDGILKMRLILQGFIDTFTERFGKLEEKFREKDGREYFLLYLKPIINGTGNYYIEAETRDQTRTDVIIDYLGRQYIIELKIWHGKSRHEEGEKQIIGYLDHYGLTIGYMLSFNFNKKKETGVRQVHIGGKLLYEGTV